MPKKAVARGFDDIPDSGNGGQKRELPSNRVPLFSFNNEKYKGKSIVVRFLPEVFSYGTHSVLIKPKKDKKGNSGRPWWATYPCSDWDHETGKFEKNGTCPMCAEFREQFSLDKEERTVRRGVDTYANMIVRAIQKRAPEDNEITEEEEESGFKDRDSESWTPIVPFRLPATVRERMTEQQVTNTAKDPKSGEVRQWPLTHPRFGCDIHIKYDPDKPPANQYSVVKGDRAPLTKEERKYLKWDLSQLWGEDADPDNLMQELKSWADRQGETLLSVKSSSKKKKSDEDDDEGFDDDEDVKPKSSSKKRRSRDEDDDDDPFGSDDDDEPKRSKKTSASKKRRSRDDEDEEEDDPFSDDDEEDEPKSRKGSRKTSASKKRRSHDEDDEEDEDEDPFDDDDEEDEEPKSRKGSKSSSKKRRSRDDDDEEDDPFEDDDEEDEDEEEPPKRRSSSKKAASKKRQSHDDEDEDEDEDEEEPPRRRSASKKAPASKKRRASKDDDDDFDDFD